MNKGIHKLFAWSYIIAGNLFFIGLIVGKIIPPMSPDMTATEVQAFISANATSIKLGSLFIILSAAFAALFDAELLTQLRRIEGNRPSGANAQFALGIANIQFFILPGVLFVVMAFRPDRDLASLQALFDLAWIATLFPWTVGAFQCLCCAIVILANPQVKNVYPRWVGFFNIWIAIGMATSSVIPFFKTGPFAWDGLIGFWFPAAMFGLWMIVMCWATLKAIDTDDGIT